MLDKRVELHNKLIEVLPDLPNIYFSPPPSLLISYPCIVYNLDDIPTTKLDGVVYKQRHKYSVTIIDKDPDSELPEQLLSGFKYCTFDRAFITDNLNHYVFELYW